MGGSRRRRQKGGGASKREEKALRAVIQTTCRKRRVEVEGKKDVGGCEVRSGADQPVGVGSHDFQLETINFQNRQHHNSYLVASNFDDRQSGYGPARPNPPELACPIPSQHCWLDRRRQERDHERERNGKARNRVRDVGPEPVNRDPEQPRLLAPTKK